MIIFSRSSTPDVVPEWMRHRIWNHGTEKQARETLRRHIQVILAMIHEYVDRNFERRIGFELEGILKTRNLHPVTETKRDLIILGDPALKDELGATQIEATKPPVVIGNGQGISPLVENITSLFQTMKQAARASDLVLLTVGIDPLILAREVKYSAKKPWYKAGQAYFNKYQVFPILPPPSLRIPRFLDGMDNPAVAGTASGLQFTFDTPNPKSAIEHLNLLVELAPEILAMSGFGSMLFQKFLGASALRIRIWKRSHNTLSAYQLARGMTGNIGMPPDYYHSFEEYLYRLLQYPIILKDRASIEQAFYTAIGHQWRTERLKFFIQNQKVCIESRVSPMQPTLEENIAVVAFAYGLLLFRAHKHGYELLPFRHVKTNFAQAEILGTRAQTYFRDGKNRIKRMPFRKLLPIRITQAQRGLEWIGINTTDAQEVLAPLKNREKVGNPGEQLVIGVRHHERKGAHGRDAIIETLHNLGALHNH